MPAILRWEALAFCWATVGSSMAAKKYSRATTPRTSGAALLFHSICSTSTIPVTIRPAAPCWYRECGCTWSSESFAALDRITRHDPIVIEILRNEKHDQIGEPHFPQLIVGRMHVGTFFPRAAAA